MEVGKKRQILQKTYDSLVPGGDFVIYQVTNELRGHATPTIFPRADSEYFLAERAADVHHRFPQGPRADRQSARLQPRKQRQQRAPRQEKQDPFAGGGSLRALSRPLLPISRRSAMTPPSTRIEKDSMGEMPVPADALYGASTQRAVLNFPSAATALAARSCARWG